MTLAEIQLLWAFNIWAEGLIFDTVARLSSEQYRRDLHSSHGGILGTLAHIISAEQGWLERWTGDRQLQQSSLQDVTSVDELRVHWQRLGEQMQQFLGTLSEAKLQEPLVVTTSQGGQFSNPYWQMIQHVVDHSSYHRGQIVTMLRQIGMTPPNTGMIRFYRETIQPA
jgi:uncharacterized damage-inducible protein DinB